MSLLILLAACSGYAQTPGQTRVPSGVLLVKGAWASASDTTTPVPEGGEVTNSAYTNSYFRLSYPLLRDWVEKYAGPPPSDSGYYVLAQLQPRDMVNGVIPGSLIITAADLFFTPTHAASSLEFIKFSRGNLQGDYQVSRQPGQITLAGHSFDRFDYFSPVAGLHWYVLATQIRCHVVQFVFTSGDVSLLDELLEGFGKIKLPDSAAAGREDPVCIKGYARSENIVTRVDPILTGRRFNPIPVRVIIDKEGRVEHIHFLSAFPEQSKEITDALRQWKFKPYLRNGQAVEVETGIMFGQ